MLAEVKLVAATVVKASCRVVLRVQMLGASCAGHRRAVCKCLCDVLRPVCPDYPFCPEYPAVLHVQCVARAVLSTECVFHRFLFFGTHMMCMRVLCHAEAILVFIV